MSSTGYTMNDVRAMRVWDLVQGEREGNTVSIPLDSRALILDRVYGSIPKDLDILSYPFTRDARVRNSVSEIWAHHMKQTLLGIPLFATQFGFQLYLQPERALQELRALHIHDFLAGHGQPKAAVDAEHLNKTLMWQLMTNTAHEADRPLNHMSVSSGMVIRQASDQVSSPQYLVPSQYHLTHFTAAMAAGALAAMPMMHGVR